MEDERLLCHEVDVVDHVAGLVPRPGFQMAFQPELVAVCVSDWRLCVVEGGRGDSQGIER